MLCCSKCGHVLRRDSVLADIGPKILKRFFPPYLDSKAIPAVSICAIANEAGLACPNCEAKGAWTEQRPSAGPEQGAIA